MIRPRILSVLVVSAALASVPSAAPAQAQPYVVEEVTLGNVAVLFLGTDADGGIGDWYLSNGAVEAIVDEVGLQTVPAGATAPPKQSEIGVTGGNIIDLGLVGADNDQLAQFFTVGGLSTSNFIPYTGISGSAGPSSASITVTGDLLGFDSDVPPPTFSSRRCTSSRTPTRT